MTTDMQFDQTKLDEIEKLNADIAHHQHRIAEWQAQIDIDQSRINGMEKRARELRCEAIGLHHHYRVKMTPDYIEFERKRGNRDHPNSNPKIYDTTQHVMLDNVNLEHNTVALELPRGWYIANVPLDVFMQMVHANHTIGEAEN